MLDIVPVETCSLRMRAWGLLIALTACGTNGTGSDAGAPDANVGCNTTEPLSSCATGWQFVGLPTQCPCASSNTQPECGKADCQTLTVVGYLGGGVEIDATIFYSAQAGTMSTWMPARTGQWNLADGGIYETLSGGRVTCATCNNAGGVCYDACNTIYQLEVPASAGWSTALNAASATGTTWTAWPVKP